MRKNKEMTTFGKIFSSTLKPDQVSCTKHSVCCSFHITTAFIRELLENVGVDISPIRLIRRIKNGLEIPGLKDALIKILQDFHLQISLLEGCQTIMNGDTADLSRQLQNNQTNGFFLTSMLNSSLNDSELKNVSLAKSACPICMQLLQQTPQSLILLFLCRHTVHASCVDGSDWVPPQPDPVLQGIGRLDVGRAISGKIAL